MQRVWKQLTAGLVAATLVAACDDGGPERRFNIAKQGGDEQFGGISATLEDPLQVVVTDASTHEPVPDVTVTWRVVAGAGAVVTPTSSRTDSSGIASTQLRLGADPGVYRVRASVGGLVGDPVEFEAQAVLPPEISAVSPAQADAGDTITIAGRNFSPNAEDNAVVFDGIRGAVISATSTQLRAAVPLCVPTRTVDVVVRLGPVASQPAALAVVGQGTGPIALQVGEVLAAFDPQDLSCLRLPGGQSGLSFLLVPQNAADVAGRTMPFQLVGLTGQATAPPPVPLGAALRAGPSLAGTGFTPAAAAWEAKLRARERELSPAAVAPAVARFLAPPPQVGDRRKFQVFNKNNEFTEVTAEVKHVSARAILYQDLNAPAGGFTTADFQAFGSLFDDPIYDTDISVFGAPSDIDGNERVIILFTTVVNELTARGTQGFIAGFFFGLDLTTESGSNRSEIFYSLVPDPEGKFSDARTKSQLLRAVPPVLAHELQHMIAFNQRVLLLRVPQEVIWLSEAIAHAAEDVLGDVFLERADTPTAANFKLPNFIRAFNYVKDPTVASVIWATSPGTLEERGASWLFLKYLMGHHGERDLLRRLTQTSRSSVSNVTAETGKSWTVLFHDWAVALWADGAPELEGAAVDPRFTFPNIDLRSRIGQIGGGYPLQPRTFAFADFAVTDTLPASSPAYVIVTASGANPPPLNLNLAGARGDPFSTLTRPQMAIMRIK